MCVIDAFECFWCILGSCDSKEHLQPIIAEGCSYHDALDEMTAHFAPPSPPHLRALAGFLYGFLCGLYV